MAIPSSALAGIRALTFDADQTLWDFDEVMQRALDRTVGEFYRTCPTLEPGAVTSDLLRETRDAIVVRHRGQAHSLENVRRESFAAVLASQGIVDDTLADHLIGFYMSIRFSEIRLYDDVRPVLRRLRGRFRLGLVSNGNTDPSRCGLPDTFDAVLLGPDHGIAKPDPAAFTFVADLLNVPTSQILHVGDGDDDIAGAKASGALAVLINRTRVQARLAEVADEVITDLYGLLALLGPAASDGDAP